MMKRLMLSLMAVLLLGYALVYEQISAVGLEKDPTQEQILNKLRKEYDKKVDGTLDVQLQLLEYAERKHGLNSIESLEYLETLAWLLMEQQDYDNASYFYRRAIKVRVESLPPSKENSKTLAVNHFYLGDTFLYRGDYELSIQSYDESLRWTADAGHKGDALTRKGFAYEGLERHPQAEESYLEALRQYDAAATLNPAHAKLYDKRVSVVHKRLPELYHKMGKNEKVKEFQDLIKDKRKERKKRESKE